MTTQPLPFPTLGAHRAAPTPTTRTAQENTVTDQLTTTINVQGMTCGSCVNHVTQELLALDGVTGVDVDLVAGGVSPVSITSTSPLAPQAVADAVDEAGYSVVA